MLQGVKIAFRKMNCQISFKCSENQPQVATLFVLVGSSNWKPAVNRQPSFLRLRRVMAARSSRADCDLHMPQRHSQTEPTQANRHTDSAEECRARRRRHREENVQSTRIAVGQVSRLTSHNAHA